MATGKRPVQTPRLVEAIKGIDDRLARTLRASFRRLSGTMQLQRDEAMRESLAADFVQSSDQ